MGTDNPVGLVVAGNGVTTLGMLTVNGDALITDNLLVNGTIAGYATQSDVDLKASIASVNTLQASLGNCYK